MGGMQIQGGGAAPLDPSQGLADLGEPEPAIDLASQVEATTTAVADLLAATETWAAHVQDPGAAVMADTLCRIPTPDDVVFTPDHQTMEEFYASMPQFVALLDSAIEHIGNALDEMIAAQGPAGAAGAAPSPTQAAPEPTQAAPAQTATQAGGGAAPSPDIDLTGADAAGGAAPTQTGGAPATSPAQTGAPQATGGAGAPAPATQTGGPAPTGSATAPTAPAGAFDPAAVPQGIRDLLRDLAHALANPPPDGPRLAEITRSVDDAVLDWMSASGEPPRAEVERQLGRSANGGGAIGGRLPPEARAAATTPPGYDQLDPARSGSPVRRGANGPEVRALQEALNRAGAQPPLDLDGAFGPATEAAVRQFQQSHGCRVDGIVGPETLGALDAALGLPRRSPPVRVPSAPSTPTPTPPDSQTPGVPAPGTLPPPSGGGWNGEGALAAAITQIGVREATGNNDGIPAERYSNGREVAWCANFVSWAFRQAGTPLPGNQVAIGSCDEMLRQLDQQGAYFQRGQGTPQPGDVIFFGRPGDSTHVGIVEKVENGRVYTVEGNTGNRVARRDYALNDSYILGYGRT